MAIKFYGYKKCDTCRRAEKLLLSSGTEYQFIDIIVNPPAVSVLKSILKKSGKPLKKILNTSGRLYRSDGMKQKISSMSDEDLIRLLSKEGYLLKRPLLVSHDRASIGLNNDFETIWLKK